MRRRLIAVVWWCVALVAHSYASAAPRDHPVLSPSSNIDTASLAVDVRRSGPLTTTRTTPTSATILSPGTIVEGYELVERTALLGVCNPRAARSDQKAVVVLPTGAVVEWSRVDKRVDADPSDEDEDDDVDENVSDAASPEKSDSDSEALCPLDEQVCTSGRQPEVGTGGELVPDGPSLEYQVRGLTRVLSHPSRGREADRVLAF
ncbi:hypothetical protein PINS_up011116 [Pythium insidiosum]|nr:hypothetical protein PINS_up011116 [Pythium insidiosum]